eukprot:Awhi_evm1s1431
MTASMERIRFVRFDGKSLHGFDAEIAIKMERKRDRAYEQKVLTWLANAVNRGAASPNPLFPWLKEKESSSIDVYPSCHATLRTGSVLIDLLNKTELLARPIKCNPPANELSFLENVRLYLNSLMSIAGCPSSCCFDAGDLVSGRDLNNVINSIASLARFLDSKNTKIVKFSSSSSSTKPSTKATLKTTASNNSKKSTITGPRKNNAVAPSPPRNSVTPNKNSNPTTAKSPQRPNTRPTTKPVAKPPQRPAQRPATEPKSTTNSKNRTQQPATKRPNVPKRPQSPKTSHAKPATNSKLVSNSPFKLSPEELEAHDRKSKAKKSNQKIHKSHSKKSN